MRTDGVGGSRGAGLVTAAYARALLDHLRSRGVKLSRLYSASTIEEIESRDGRTQIPLTQWLAMIETAISVTHDADLPLKVGMGIQPKHIGMLSYVVMSCATLGDMAAQLERYSRLVGDISHTQLRRRGRTVQLVWQWAHPSSAPPSVAPLQLASRIALGRWLTGRPDRTAAACFQFKRPVNAALYDRFFGEDTRFDQAETKLVIRASDLKLPIITADPEMQKLAATQADAALKALAGEPDFVRELKTVLMCGLAVSRVSLAASAQSLNTSVRSLQRRLDEHRCSYRQVLDEVRLTQAARYLKDPHTSLAQVAFMLGYSEQSTFHNAFKRWTGTTPIAFRKANGESG